MKCLFLSVGIIKVNLLHQICGGLSEWLRMIIIFQRMNINDVCMSYVNTQTKMQRVK